MSHISSQTLEYSDHKEELRILAEALRLIGEKDIAGATRLLVIRHDALIMDQVPKVKPYDPV